MYSHTAECGMCCVIHDEALVNSFKKAFPETKKQTEKPQKPWHQVEATAWIEANISVGSLLKDFLLLIQGRKPAQPESFQDIAQHAVRLPMAA